MAEMKFRIVIERAAHVVAQLLLDRPANHVAHGVKIKMKIERDIVIEADHFVVKGVAAKERQTKRDDSIADPPNKKSRGFRHFLRDAKKKFLAQVFELHRRTLVDLEIKWKNLINDR